CRDTLIAYVNALDWKIQARDSTMQDELSDEIDYYTRGFEYEFGMDFSEHIEWTGQDILTITLGAAAEVIREGDAPEGRVLTIIPLDGATLFPTLSKKLPVGQRVLGYDLDTVFFPYYAINRIYLSPRPQIKREGWGMAPPEKVYLSLEMLRRGDVYYANLLLDTPEAGILDLMDMEKESAEQWIESFRSLLGGIDPFKIPVLYEHEKDVKWIPFSRPPSEIMFNEISLKQASYVAAGYGLSLGDLGIQAASSGGETLAGSIRQERKTRKSLLSVLKKKYVTYWNRLLPETLEFAWIDYDDELNVQKGRARMSTMTAFSQAIDKRMLTPQEGRLQLVRDGIITISIPEEIPMEDFDILPEEGLSPARPGEIGNPVPPSQGGHGEPEIGRSMSEDAMGVVLKQSFEDFLGNATKDKLERLIRLIAPKVFHQVKGAMKELSSSQEVRRWNLFHEKALYGKGEEDVKIQKASDDEKMNNDLEKDEWWLLDIDEEEIVAILSIAYIVALRNAAEEIAQDMYLSGVLESPVLDPNVVFRLVNERILKELAEKAALMVTNVNEGTKYYLRRMLVSGIRRGLTDAEIIAKIRAGVDIKEILDDNLFMQRVSTAVKSQIRDLTEVRIRSIVSFEVRSAEAKAWLDQYKAMGLTKKAWQHYGSDIPCEICEENIALGFVPIDYKFESVFGAVEGPLAHPHGHCGLVYNKEEVTALIRDGNFIIWTGD
ncbi:MAG: hypothetical protein KAR20_02945, partial [Candidatus Heimdallarchaeota archaeon]|nr:hypothetical protein [Candidatus Heimdallarchaeota archaeon]